MPSPMVSIGTSEAVEHTLTTWPSPPNAHDPAAGADGAGGGGHPIDVDVAHDDMHAFVVERGGDGEADPAGGAGDHRGVLRELSHSPPPPLDHQPLGLAGL